MIEYGGVVYYIDLKAFDKFITITKPDEKLETKEFKITRDADSTILSTEEYTHITDKQKEVNAPNFDILRTMIEILLESEDGDEEDTTLGADRALEKKPLSYQLCFNTLMNYGILKEKE
jgi:hypothetical protein